MSASTQVKPEQADGNGGTQDAIDISDWPYEYRVVPLDKMFVDKVYQRPLSNLVGRVERNFDPALIGTLVCSERHDGTYALVDGQTRMEGAKRRGIVELPAVVFMGLTRAQEADLFHRLQKERRSITSYDGFRAALAAGDKEAKAINRIARAAGYELGREKGKHVTAVAACANAYRRSPAILERTLIILREAWAERHMPPGAVIRGLGYWLQYREEEGKKTDDARMARHIGVISPTELLRRADMLKEGVGAGGKGEKWVAQVLDSVYARSA